MKTMAIRLTEETSAQLTMLGQLEGTTVAELIRQAIDALLEAKRSNPELEAKAADVLDAIEADATARKQAIQALLASGDKPKGTSSRRKPGGEPGS